MKRHKLICVAGARPNFMKVAPLLRLLRSAPNFEAVLVHTGQHYDDKLSGQFFRDLELPPPDHFLSVGSGSHARQTAEIMTRFEPIVMAESPDGVVVVGDVNSTVAAAFVAAKMHIPVIHIESGLRSFDRAMPEEINRLMTDAVSDLLFVTEESGRRNLLNEGIPKHRIHFAGNLMIDSLHRMLPRALKSPVLDSLGLSKKRFGLLTLHRPSNVDNPKRFSEILDVLAEIAGTLPLIFPVHPRTRASVVNGAGRYDNIRFIDPLGYSDFVCLMANSFVVFTDSGGVQEETTVLGVPCLTLRENTERPVTIERGTNVLAGTSRASIFEAWKTAALRPQSGRVPPLWDGASAERHLAVLSEYFRRRYADNAPFSTIPAAMAQTVGGYVPGGQP